MERKLKMSQDQKIFHIVGKKVIIRVKSRLCETPEEMIGSELFAEIIRRSIVELKRRKSIMCQLFPESKTVEKHVAQIVEIMKYLVKMPLNLIPNIIPGTQNFVDDADLLFKYIEYLYNFWRAFERFVILDSTDDTLDKRPYRTFNATVEQLTHLVRQVYRDLQANIFNAHPNTYRQVRAGAGFATIALAKDLPLPDKYKAKLKDITVIRQVLLNPPLVLNPPMNKRTGKFAKVDRNPFDVIEIKPDEWVCFPVKAGPLVILVYFSEIFYELGFSLVNLFEIASDEDLSRTPDGIYFFGVPGTSLDALGEFATAFHEDVENKLFVAGVPGRAEFGYFGYLKKMILTLHNCAMMKRGLLPYHGSLTKIVFEGKIEKSVLIIGDTGAGKSETLEAFQDLAGEQVSDIIPVADDMGSLEITPEGKIIGYGTEIGAFLRLDDLKPGAAFNQLDRSIFMSMGQVNSRVIIPITQLSEVIKGTPIDVVLYANNYENLDENHPVIQQLKTPEEALAVFREGTAMSKGTTTSTGLVHTYFTNIFGPPAYKTLHDELAVKFFDLLYKNGVFVGQLRTRLGINGFERKGPEEAAKALIELIQPKK
jgi:energy-coupling factor transporter ATP-binding protein EcfA2